MFSALEVASRARALEALLIHVLVGTPGILQRHNLFENLTLEGDDDVEEGEEIVETKYDFEAKARFVY